MKKIKLFLEAAVVIAVVMALILPGAAVVTNTTTEEVVDPMWKGRTRRAIDHALTWSPEEKPLPLMTGENIQVSGWTEGDDIRPAITKDEQGHVFITYQHDENLLTSSAGFAYNSNPLDQQAWWDNGVILALDGVEQILYPDTATCEHPNYPLMNVFVALDTEEAGGMYIPDPTDYETWEIYTWNEGAPEPDSAHISDGGWYDDYYYPGEIIGPHNFYIYREIYDVYDIPHCPIFFHTGIDAESGVGYFDAQSFEKTAPAADGDIVNLEDRMHTSIYNFETEKVIWKKIDPAVDSDYEFTPFQATVADGTNPAIAAYDENVAIVYHHDGEIKCVYSEDDGDSWSTPVVIDDGEYPDAFAVGSTVYAVYVNDNNLYLVESNDGGASWSTPEQVNDEEGSVIAEENCCDVHAGGIVWVDDRNGEYNIYYAQLIAQSEPPSDPTITGPNNGKPNTEYTFTLSSTDPESDDVYYYVEWGDGTNSGWVGPYSSGAGATVSHSWSSEDSFTIRAKAKDTSDSESGWSTKAFSTPRTRTIFNFLENFPILYQFLKNFFGI